MQMKQLIKEQSHICKQLQKNIHRFSFATKSVLGRRSRRKILEYLVQAFMNNTQEFDGEVLTNRCSLMGNKKVQEEENCQITGQKRQKSHLCMGLKDQEMIQSHISFNYNQLFDSF